jgi:hypothetical protein
MSSLPTWAIWLVAVPLVLLSPVIALSLALAVEIAVYAFIDGGPKIQFVVGTAAVALVLWRRVPARSGRWSRTRDGQPGSG